MGQEPHISFADGERVKEELLEIGPTVLQRRSVCDTNTKVEWDDDYDTSKPTFSNIKIQNDSDVNDEKEPPHDELRLRMDFFSVVESLKDETDSQEVEDIKPVIPEMSLKWEEGEGQSASEVQTRVLVPTESRAGDSLIRAARPALEGNHAAAAREDTHCIRTPSDKLLQFKIINATLTQTGDSHTGDRPFECDICNAKFTHAGYLTAHKRKHNGERPFECELCNAKFTQAGHLKIHKRSRTGERPFECDTCNAKFTNAGSLIIHKRIHTGERPFECETCNAKFTQAGNLTIHKRTHTGEKLFECEMCNAKFAFGGNLKRHKRTHTGERPFECKTCNAKFTNAGHLKRHKRTHTGERPFTCATCNAKFKRADHFKSHKAHCQIREKKIMSAF